MRFFCLLGVIKMIKKATINDCNILAQLAINMWYNNTIEDLTNDFKNILTSFDKVCFIKYIDNEPIGFAECSKRSDYVEGTKSSPVGYLEGIFILENYRLNGFAKQLLEYCESWAKEEGCIEFASDCEVINHESLAFHKALGFVEVNRIVCLKKDI